MALTYIPTNTTNTIVQAADINQILYCLQRASGQTEIGCWMLAQSGYTTSALLNWWVGLNNRFSTPVSVSLSTSIGAMTGTTAAQSMGSIHPNGFQVYAFSSAANGNCFGGGVFTATF
jgi:hypothetical protein